MIEGKTLEYFKDDKRAYAKIIEAGSGKKLYRCRTYKFDENAIYNGEFRMIDAPCDKFRSLEIFARDINCNKFKTLREFLVYIKE